MNQPSFYRCSLFKEKIDNYENFSFLQDEIILKSLLADGKAEFSISKIKYNCKFKKMVDFQVSNPLAIIPIKDSRELLKFTLENFKKFDVFKHANFIIVDDRSEEDLLSLCLDYPVNYLRVDNEKGFNFSMLNNIAAKIADEFGFTEIILWNSDLWVDSKDTIPNLIKLHKENNSTISGTRLLYPTFSWNGQENSDNVKSVFPGKINSYRGTIQFGGSVFSFNTHFMTYFPNHFCRFKDKDFYLSKCDKIDTFVTGAFQIIDLKWFIDIGGLNPSLSKAFQDVDLCLLATSENKKVYYFGKDNYLLHDESVQLSDKKNDNQFLSDHIVYEKRWNYKEFATKIQKFEV